MAAQGILFAFLVVYLGLQAWTYGLADPGRTFQSAYCLEAPASDAPIIAYMQREHVSYAWASNWLAYGIVFKTDGSIVAADPLPFLPRSPNIDRVPANTEAVRHADRPALLVFVHHVPGRAAGYVPSRAFPVAAGHRCACRHAFEPHGLAIRVTGFSKHFYELQ